MKAMQSKSNRTENILTKQMRKKERMRYREAGMIYLFERGEEIGVKRRSRSHFFSLWVDYNDSRLYKSIQNGLLKYYLSIFSQI